MAWLWLLLAFALFMALLRSVYSVNRAAVRRFGYEPFSLPNAALMLLVNLLLLSALGPVAEGQRALGGVGLVKLGAAGVLATGMLVVIARRTTVRYGLYAVVVMSVGAIAVLPSLLFMSMAGASPTVDTPKPEDPSDRDA
jgi:hypothetical protein